MGWIPKEERFCIDCGKKGVVERRRCKECAKEYNRQRARKRNKEKGRHNYGQSICPICGKPMIMWRRDQASHITCRPKMMEDTYNKKVKFSHDGRTFANYLVNSWGVDIPDDHVVHHLDENPDNNSPENLVIVDRAAHNSLHRKLQYHRSLWLKDQSKYSVNCWEALRDQITTAWLETTNAKVVKYLILGNQQPST